jgi:branched-chain amino acid transport system ATP-binding protein
VYEALARIREQGTATVIIEQHAERVLEIAERAVVLSHGSVSYDGPAADALEAASSEFGGR